MPKGKRRIVPVPAVNGVIFNSAGEVFLTRRSPAVREPGKWCLPGGHFDGGEDWVTAMRREMQEETGLTVTSEKLIGIYSDPTLTISQEPLPEGYFAQFVTAVFLVTAYEGEIQPNHEVDQFGFFPVDRLPEPILKSHPVRVRDGLLYKGDVFVR